MRMIAGTEKVIRKGIVMSKKRTDDEKNLRCYKKDKRIAWRFFLTIILLVTTNGRVSLSTENKVNVHQCLKVSSPPVIDGKLNDACWLKVKKITHFVPIAISERGLSSEQTVGYLAYDADNLYLGFKCISDDKDIVPFCEERDGEDFFGNDDNIEIFISPGLGQDYYHLAVNSAGIQYDAKGYYTLWDGDWKAAATIEDGVWFLEISLPFKMLDVDTKEDFIWRISLNRSIYSEAIYCSWCNPGSETGGYHSPSYFGYLIFGKPDTDLYKKLMKGVR